MTQRLVLVFASLVVLAGCASTEAVTDEASLEAEASTVAVEETVVEESAVEAVETETEATEPTEATKAELELAEANVEESSSNLDPNRKVCKTIEITGSRIARKRVCRTAQQWEALEDATENNMRRRLRNTSLSN